MRYFLLILLSFIFVLPTFAEIKEVTSVSDIPNGYNFISPTGYYENGTDTKYQVTG
jgi:hypothetical protein